MGIRAKQLTADTFDNTTAGRAPFGTDLFDATLTSDVFVNGAIDTDSLADGAATAAKIDPDLAGNGLSKSGTAAMTVDPDSETGGNIAPVSVGANGVGLDISAIAGTSLEADGSANLRIATSAAGNGLTGGGASALAVGAGTGITVNANDVTIDTTSTVTFVDDAATAWTFPVGTTAQGLFVTGTPVDANHGVNKAYVDSVATGLQWLDPIVCHDMIGNLGEVALEALSPSTSDSYVVSATDGDSTLNPGSLAIAVGDVVEFDGTNWVKIVSNAAGAPPAGVRFALNTTTALISPYTDGVDDGKIAEYDGTGILIGDITLTTPNDGDAVLVVGNEGDTDPVDLFNGYTFDGTVPTGTWIQFTGAGQINAGAGLTKTANTLDVGAGNGIAVAADSVSVNPDTTTGANIQPLNVVANGAGVDINAIAGTGIEADGSANLRLATQGTGIAGGAGSTLSFDATAADGAGLSGTGAVLTVVAATAASAQQYGGLVVDRNAAGTAGGAGAAGYLAIQTDDSSLEVSASNQLQVKAQGIAASMLGAVAGDGLNGGAGSVLSVDATDASITVAAAGISVNPAALITGGAQEIDGDQLDIDFTPANYTPDTGPAEVTNVDHLSAHLKGIDNAIAAAGGTPRQEAVTTQVITGTDTAITDTLNNTPSSTAALKLYLNGILQIQGAGEDYTVSGTTITWLANTGTAVDMDTADDLIAVYES
jgi:hypothetical protein